MFYGSRITILCPNVFGLTFQVGFHFVREKYVVLELNLLKKSSREFHCAHKRIFFKTKYDERYIS